MNIKNNKKANKTQKGNNSQSKGAANVREIPTPTYALSPNTALKSKLQNIAKVINTNTSKEKSQSAPVGQINENLNQTGTNPRDVISVAWAKNLDEIRMAQRLRYQVFASEMGAQLNTPISGHDIDIFDDYCEHLLVKDEISGQVIGTYRVLTPAQAKRVGSTYSDTEFDLTRLRGLRDKMLELGRSCVHPEHRHGGVIMALWGALGEFMVKNNLDTMIGCASIPMLHNGVISADIAASIWQQVSQKYLAPIEYQVRPRLALPLEKLNSNLPIEPPALIKAYIRLGTRVLGPPAWDPDFNTADLPMLMRISEMPARYRKHLLGIN